jgi:hypothetical protein
LSEKKKRRNREEMGEIERENKAVGSEEREKEE